MHERAGGPQESAAMLDDTIASIEDRLRRVGTTAAQASGAAPPQLDDLIRIASTLDPEDLRALLDFARRLARPRAGAKPQAGVDRASAAKLVL